MSIRQKFFSRRAVYGLFHFLFLALPMYLVSRIKFNHKGKDIWLIAERYNEARDNGYHLFNYIMKKNNENVDCYYVIHKNSVDLEKLMPYKNIIHFGTYRHYLYYYNAKVLISTHGAGNGCMPNIYACKLIELLFPLKSKKVYLKHGIIKDYLPSLHKKKAKIDLFVCGAVPEYKLVKEKFGYNKSEVKLLGLARFDELINFKQKRQILYMPTWRTYLRNLNEKNFKKTFYYKKISSLLNNTKLNEYLYQNDIDFIFCLHPMLNKYTNLFTTECYRIRIINLEHTDLQTLLKDSSLLITDHSSIYFDFAYMNKPIIYYQFDNKDFYETHPGNRTFDYEKYGFGPLITNEKELINEIIQICNKGFISKDIYTKRINEWFPFKDDKNCERIYNAIIKL